MTAWRQSPAGLLHPDFLEILGFCSDHFDLVGILTNGTLFTPEIFEKLGAWKNKLVFSISLDSYIPHVHDNRRGHFGAFEKTAAAITTLSKMGFVVRVSVVLDENNWKDLEGTIVLAKKIGASMLTYGPVLPFGRASKDSFLWKLRAQEVAEVGAALKERYEGFLHSIDEPTLLEVEGPGGCGAGHRVYAMNPKGKIRPCVSFGENQAVIGSLESEAPDVVFNRPLVLASAHLSPPTAKVCGSCKWIGFCMHCSLRGVLASKWLLDGACKWLNQKNVLEWYCSYGRNKLGIDI